MNYPKWGIAVLMLCCCAHGVAVAAPTYAEAQNALTLQSELVQGAFFPSIDCSQQFVDGPMRNYSGQMARAEYPMASASANLVAATLAKCAEVNKMPVAQAADLVGQYLAMSVVADIRMSPGIVTSVTNAKFDRATRLLEYASANGSAQAGDVLKMMQKAAGTDTAAPDSPLAYSGSAVALVDKFAANTFAFEQQYIGKRLRVTGKVTSINGGGDRAFVSILGNITKDNDHLRLIDTIHCTVSSASELQNAATLSVNRNATVQGTYGKSAVGIELKNCQILKAASPTGNAVR